MLDYIFQDWSVNSNSSKSRLVLVFYRYVSYLSSKKGMSNKILYPVFYFLYIIIVQWFIGIEIPVSARIGKGLKIYHGFGLVVHPATVMGSGCVLRHCTTIGTKDNSNVNKQTAPVIGDNVDVGCNAVIIGPITIGKESIIGAGSVVVHNVPEKSVVCGNPARVTKKNDLC
jgi:putative colanic acid biosynthesis acetyltransferase WcaB